MVEHLPSKQYIVGLSPTGAALYILYVKKMFWLVVLPCFDLCTSISFH